MPQGAVTANLQQTLFITESGLLGFCKISATVIDDPLKGAQLAALNFDPAGLAYVADL